MHGHFHENVVMTGTQSESLISAIRNNNVVPENRPTENTPGNSNIVPRINNAIKIQNFGGSLDEDIDLWLFAFKNWQVASGISENSTLIAIAANHLTKNALAWFQSWCTQSENPYGSWDIFEKSLKDRFNTGQKKRKLRETLHYLKQKTSVSLNSEELLNLKTTMGTMTEEEALDRFIRNLKPHIRVSVLVHDPENLLLAMKIAETYD
ncbi:hypothetical protein AYI69_g970 [Smittium culicis]|uniref:Ty3 transposon capsid-like protein domain-containing protein n=1 Tax=Smittium culicis TaxID=133412 RepID=A0A1R1YRW9_9FUNG|nr:hypothetical protein AYI69_g970 [Smittium culicis]